MFNLTQEQLYTASHWINNHDCPIEYEGAIGGKITYCFTPTSVGVVQTVKCHCGKDINLTDYESW